MQQQNLWAPWRMQYIQKLDPDAHRSDDARGCFLCEALAAEPGSDDARERLVLLRDGRGMIIMNRYPYTNGHLLIAPAAHVGRLSDLEPEARAGLMELAALGERLLELAMNPQGINLGINLGRCAGAGLPGHLHLHLVPRWNGDTNFMSVIGQVRVIPQALEQAYEWFAQTLAKLEQSGGGATA